MDTISFQIGAQVIVFYIFAIYLTLLGMGLLALLVLHVTLQIVHLRQYR